MKTRILCTAALAVCLSAFAPAPAARADALRCQRTISLASAAFAKTKTRIVNACKQAAVRTGMPASPTDCPLPAQEDRIDVAAQRLRDRIARDCGGANKVCNATDVNEDADVPLADIGWDIGTCPDLNGQGCANPVADCDDVATCVLCVDHEAVNQPVDLAYDLMTAAQFGTLSEVNLCQLAIGRESAKVLRKGFVQLSRCWDRVLRAKPGFTLPPGCPTTDPATLARLRNAEARKIDHICRDCGAGGDADGDGFCDLPGEAIGPAAVGFEPDCPDKVVPGGASCARVVTTLDDLIACVACLGSFELACSTSLALPNHVPYPAECTAVQ